MDSQLFWELSLLGILLVITRVLYLMFEITTGHTRSRKLYGRSNCKTMIFIGSGGHTTEMLKLLEGVDFLTFKPRFYVIAKTDQRSYDKVVNFEQEKGDSADYSIIRVPRSREVHQSYLTSMITTLYSILYSFPIILKTWPDLLICNGPGSCVPICFVCFLMKCFFIKNIQIVFIESFCRVKSFSLTGRIMAYVADNFLVHWLELRNKMKRTEYIGRLISIMEERLPTSSAQDGNIHHITTRFKEQVTTEDSNFHDNDDLEEEISAQMTQSYSEISFKTDPSPGDESLSLPGASPLPLAHHITQRPATLPYDRNFTPNRPSNLEGTFHREGNMTHYVTDNLEYKIKLSSPVSKKSDTVSSSSKSSTPMSLHRSNIFPQMGLPNLGLLQDLEDEAQSMATSIDSLTENLCEILQSISSLTAQNIDIYKDAVTKMSEAMDSNIKSMYTMMAKAEEVSKSMKNVQVYAQRIKDIRRLVDLFESYL